MKRLVKAVDNTIDKSVGNFIGLACWDIDIYDLEDMYDNVVDDDTIECFIDDYMDIDLIDDSFSHAFGTEYGEHLEAKLKKYKPDDSFRKWLLDACKPQFPAKEKVQEALDIIKANPEIADKMDYCIEDLESCNYNADAISKKVEEFLTSDETVNRYYRWLAEEGAEKVSERDPEDYRDYDDYDYDYYYYQ